MFSKLIHRETVDSAPGSKARLRRRGKGETYSVFLRGRALPRAAASRRKQPFRQSVRCKELFHTPENAGGPLVLTRVQKKGNGKPSMCGALGGVIPMGAIHELDLGAVKKKATTVSRRRP